MDIKILKTNQHEATELFNIQKEAFQSDFERYQDYKTSPVTETYESFLRRIRRSFHYTIYQGNKIIGGINVMKLSNHHYWIHEIFLKPSCQNKGFGSEIMKQVEQLFKNAKSWSLNTPKDNTRNRHFYEKFGYKQINEMKINNELTLIEYIKIM